MIPDHLPGNATRQFKYSQIPWVFQGIYRPTRLNKLYDLFPLSLVSIISIVCKGVA